MQVYPFTLYNNEYDDFMGRMAVSQQGKKIMKDRFANRTFVIKQISSPGANIVKQHLLSLGGEAAVPKHSVNCSKDKSDLLFSIRKDKVGDLVKRFKQQCWGLDRVAEFIQEWEDQSEPWFNFQDDHIKTEKPIIMGILNVTPDSFSDGGKFDQLELAVKHAESLISSGALIIDVGGESTRPGADPVSIEEQIRRTVPVIKEIRKKNREVAISIDTTSSVVAKEAIEAGATMVNDISGLSFDSNMAKVVAEHGVSIVIMYIKGTPGTMQEAPEYKDVISEVHSFFEDAVEKAEEAGIDRNKIILDPGIGFGKRLEHNLYILRHLDSFSSFSMPLLVGASRKSFIGAVTGEAVAEKRVAGTTATNMIALAQGAAILRVHDVTEANAAIMMHSAVREVGCC